MSSSRIVLSRVALLLALSTVSIMAGNYQPIPLSNDSFTQDVVVEKGAPPPPAAVTTASMDGGAANTGNSWYETGFNQDAPDTGLPAAGSTVTSETFADHSYKLAPSYTNNDAVLIDSTLTNATLTLQTPAPYAALSFLTSAGHGPMTVNVTVHHADGSTETNSLVSLDWFGGTNVAFTANGRTDVGSRAFDSVSGGNPRLYTVDLNLTNTTSPVSSVDFHYTTGAGAAAVFALSGGSSTSGFTPITVTGYNADIVVEANAPQGLTSLNATTASLDAGVANTGFSLYERGYNTAAPLTGLPAAGTTLTNQSASDHLYQLPSNYTNNDAVLIDTDNTTATLTFTTPAAFSGLSFLGASGGGAVTINYTINHSSGNPDSGTLVIPDWFNNVPVALTNSGRVNVQNASFDSVGTANPRLYGVDVSVSNTTPVTNISLNYNTGAGHAVIFAVSGATGSIKPIIDVQPSGTNIFAGTAVNLSVSASGAGPLQYQWQHLVNGTYAPVSEGQGITGSTTANLSLSNPTAAQGGSYQVVVSNPIGSTTSAPVVVNVLSTATDITSPNDQVTAFGGTSPAAEVVANAVDNTTAKYLNFGTDNDQNPPFVGPVGLVVTPAMGSTVVTGLRVYTANDVPDRDPADYTLEGSNDGTNFTQIASGPLSLPDGRNATGNPIDPLSQFNQEVLFSNTAGYTSYRLTFHNVKNNATANSMQIGEIELLGTAGSGTATGPKVTITRGANGSLTISSSQPGTLESTTALSANTTWTDEGPISGSVTVTPSGTAKFYRVVPQ